MLPEPWNLTIMCIAMGGAQFF